MNKTDRVVSAHIHKWVKVVESPRVLQMSGIFDVPPMQRSEETWDVSFTLPERWNIGLIVGPSGSGKTSIARELWGDRLDRSYTWQENASILDDFPARMPIKDIIALLSSVGFSSPPNWLRPFHVLSNGEQFRVYIARVIAEMQDLAVVDEFTSVVDRTVAQVGSAAIAKTLRKMDKQFIAISCHYDIIDWLEPDWIYNTASGEFTVCQDSSGRYLRRRPPIHLEVRRVNYAAWKLFSRFHYLDRNINKSSRCFVAYIQDAPVAFCAVISFPHALSPAWRISRLVTMPDYQGIGIGARLGEFLGSAFVAATGKPFRITMSHPALISSYRRSSSWRLYRSPRRSGKVGKTSTLSLVSRRSVATKRLTAGFEYVGPRMDRAQALQLTGEFSPNRKLSGGNYDVPHQRSFTTGKSLSHPPRGKKAQHRAKGT